jgi:hypothetical protein
MVGTSEHRLFLLLTEFPKFEAVEQALAYFDLSTATIEGEPGKR